MTAYHQTHRYEVHNRRDSDAVVGVVISDSLDRAQRKLDRISRPGASLYCWRPGWQTFGLAEAEAVLGDTRPISPQALRGIAIMQDPRGIVETIAAGFRAQREPCLHEIARGTSGCGDDE